MAFDKFRRSGNPNDATPYTQFLALVAPLSQDELSIVFDAAICGFQPPVSGPPCPTRNAGKPSINSFVACRLLIPVTNTSAEEISTLQNVGASNIVLPFYISYWVPNSHSCLNSLTREGLLSRRISPDISPSRLSLNVFVAFVPPDYAI